MATVEFRYDPKNTAWFTANAAMVLKAGEPAYHDTTGLFKLGDGVTALSALSFLPTVTASTPTIQQVLTAGQVATTTIETTGFIKTGGLSTQFLKADGTVDSSTYLTTLGTAATSLTTSGSSGAATLIANVLNVPNYTLAGLGGTTLAAVNAQNLSVFAATTSSQLAGVISDETGSGALVFGTSPTFTTSIITPNVTGVSGNLTLTNAIQSSGAITQFTFTNVANTNQTATTNIPNFRITGANKQWATGTVANQYWNYLTANTASFVGASTITNSYGLFVEAATAGTNATITNNYAFGTNGNIAIQSATATVSSPIGSLTLYGNSQTILNTSGVQNIICDYYKITFNGGTITSGSHTTYLFNASNFSNQTASTNLPNFRVNGSSKQWLTGAITNQYWNYFSANTASFVGASTMTNSYGLFVEAATAGTNATITNNYSFGTNGKAKFGGNIELTQTVTTEALTSDRSVTIVINGVTYKLLAKA